MHATQFVYTLCCSYETISFEKNNNSTLKTAWSLFDYFSKFIFLFLCCSWHCFIVNFFFANMTCKGLMWKVDSLNIEIHIRKLTFVLYMIALFYWIWSLWGQIKEIAPFLFWNWYQKVCYVLHVIWPENFKKSVVVFARVKNVVR